MIYSRSWCVNGRELTCRGRRGRKTEDSKFHLRYKRPGLLAVFYSSVRKSEPHVLSCEEMRIYSLATRRWRRDLPIVVVELPQLLDRWVSACVLVFSEWRQAKKIFISNKTRSVSYTRNFRQKCTVACIKSSYMLSKNFEYIFNFLFCPSEVVSVHLPAEF